MTRIYNPFLSTTHRAGMKARTPKPKPEAKAPVVENEAKTATPPDQISLEVVTDPEGCALIYDGEELPIMTPCTVTLQLGGELKIKKAGYHQRRRKVDHETDNPLVVQLRKR